MNAKLFRATLLAGSVASLVASCSGSSGSEVAVVKPAASTGAPAATVTAPTVAPAVAALAGRYGHFDGVAYQSTQMKTLIVSFGFTDFWVENGVLMTKQSFCHADHRSDQTITVTMSDAATSAIKPIATAVKVTTIDGKTRIYRPPTPTGIGIRLQDPANESLPTDPNDPRIVDDDGDGKPGVTASIVVSPELKGEIYLARREIFAYDLEVQPDRTLTGTVTDKSEQLVVGASNDLFKTQAAWTQFPDLSKSPIVLVPVEADWDCARLMAERPALLPPTPNVDW